MRHWSSRPRRLEAQVCVALLTLCLFALQQTTNDVRVHWISQVLQLQDLHLPLSPFLLLLIADIATVPYPEGCQATLPPLDANHAIGLEPADHTHPMLQGGSGHHHLSVERKSNACLTSLPLEILFHL